MKLMTLCYLENDGRYLMLHRTAKENDPSHGKWIGVGGKFEEGESPEECVTREVMEETGFVLTDYKFRGIVTFVSDEWESEYMHIFTANGFAERQVNQTGGSARYMLAYYDKARYDFPLRECSEGRLAWVDKDKIKDLNLWEGDRIFLKLLMDSDEFFSLKFVYKGDELAEVHIDGRLLEGDVPYLK